ncbi:MAG: thioesterase family protein [Clostridiales bacterium]|nr:thioesterase family protein [Clostridiales bacterium]
MKDISVGTSITVDAIVEENMLAKSVGSGDLEVFATPMMIALMEKSAAASLAQFLDDGETSVGTMVNISHLSATAKGRSVSATATITAIDGRQVDFDITASDDVGLIGKGTHSRFIVDSNKFMEKTLNK